MTSIIIVYHTQVLKCSTTIYGFSAGVYLSWNNSRSDFMPRAETRWCPFIWISVYFIKAWNHGYRYINFQSTNYSFFHIYSFSIKHNQYGFLWNCFVMYPIDIPLSFPSENISFKTLLHTFACVPRYVLYLKHSFFVGISRSYFTSCAFRRKTWQQVSVTCYCMIYR